MQFQETKKSPPAPDVSSNDMTTNDVAASSSREAVNTTERNAAISKIAAGVDDTIALIDRNINVAIMGMQAETCAMAQEDIHYSNTWAGFGSIIYRKVIPNFFSGGRLAQGEKARVQASIARMNNFQEQLGDLHAFKEEISEIKNVFLSKLGVEIPPKDPEEISHIGLYQYENKKLQDYISAARDALAKDDFSFLNALLSYSDPAIQLRYPLGFETGNPLISINSAESLRLNEQAMVAQAKGDTNLAISNGLLKATEVMGNVADVCLIFLGGGAFAEGKAGLTLMAKGALQTGKRSYIIPGMKKVATNVTKHSFIEGAKCTTLTGTVLATKDVAKEAAVQTLEYKVGNKNSETAVEDFKRNATAAVEKKVGLTAGAITLGAFTRITLAGLEKVAPGKDVLGFTGKLGITALSGLYGLHVGDESAKEVINAIYEFKDDPTKLPSVNPVKPITEGFWKMGNDIHWVVGGMELLAQAVGRAWGILPPALPPQLPLPPLEPLKSFNEKVLIINDRQDGQTAVVDLCERVDDFFFPYIGLTGVGTICLDALDTNAVLCDDILHVWNEKHMAIINKNDPKNFELKEYDGTVPDGEKVPNENIRVTAASFFLEGKT